MAEPIIPLTTGAWFMAIAWMFSVRGGSGLAPGAFIMGFWGLLMLGVGLLTPDYAVTGTGAVAIFLACLAMAIGSALVPIKRTSYVPRWRNHPVESGNGHFLLSACVGGSLLGLAAIAAYTLGAGFSLVSLFSLQDIFSLAHYYSYSRYNIPGFREPNLAVFLTSFMYWAGFCGGARFALGGKWFQRILSMACFVPAIGITLILTTRASFLFTGIMWLAGYLAVSAMLTGGRWRVLSKKRVIVAVVAVIAAAGMYVVGGMFRSGRVGVSHIATSLPNLFSAFMGSVPAFSVWIGRAWDAPAPLGLGSSTLAGPLGLLFSIKRAHFNPMIVGHGNINSAPTTVYTLFREVIYDYSLPGALIILILFGFMGALAWRGALSRRWFGVVILAAFYLVVMTSFVGSPFAYTTILVGWIMFALTLFLERGLWKKKRI